MIIIYSTVYGVGHLTNPNTNKPTEEIRGSESKYFEGFHSACFPGVESQIDVRHFEILKIVYEGGG